MKTFVSPTAFKNRLLASLSTGDVQRISPFLVPISLTSGQTLHDPQHLVENVYFLEEGLCSVVVDLENGGCVEVGLVGRDGFVGVPGFLGSGRTTVRSWIQIAGSGFTVHAKILRELCDESRDLRLNLQRCIEAYIAQTTQIAACNRVHQLEQRLARWLLMCHERVQHENLALTHELLATMLGTRRTTVSVAAGLLQSSGLIHYSRGHLRITDTKKLEEAACECYQVMRDKYVQLGLL